MDFENKAESLAEKMNKLTAKITADLEIAEELDITGEDIIEYVEEKTQDIELFSEKHPNIISRSDVININIMADDFKYGRDILKDTVENTKKILNSLTLDLLDADDEKKSGMILSYAELNKALKDVMKLYFDSYKDISTTLLNLDKIQKNEKESGPKTINNTVNITSQEPISTTDLINKLKG